MGLFQDILDGAVDEQSNLAAVLRRCLILASKLGHEPFRQWVSQELNGYRSVEELPDYRVLKSHSLCNLAGRWPLKNQPIPTSGLSREMREMAETLRFREGVDALLRLLEADELGVMWPEGAIRRLSALLDNGMVCTRAWVVVPVGAIPGVLGAIRSRVIDFTLSIEEDFPEVEKAPVGSKPVPLEQVEQRYQTIIMGQGHSITFGGGSIVSQRIERQVVVGDAASLRGYLAQQGIEEPDLAELDAALTEGATVDDLRNERSRLRRWVETVADKASKGATDLAKTATRELILLTVRYYFGDVTTPDARPK